jgi:hypothetical protein
MLNWGSGGILNSIGGNLTVMSSIAPRNVFSVPGGFPAAVAFASWTKKSPTVLNKSAAARWSAEARSATSVAVEVKSRASFSSSESFSSAFAISRRWNKRGSARIRPVALSRRETSEALGRANTSYGKAIAKP